jgi:hypothetical protein
MTPYSSSIGRRSPVRWLARLLLATIALSSGLVAVTEAADGQATTFATPAEAGQALQAAARASDENALGKILGPESKAVLSSGDANEDKAALASFVDKYDEMNRWASLTDGGQILYIGADNYPYPIPLRKDAAARWYFDTGAGADEIVARRIGSNELLAIDAVNAIANAEGAWFQGAHQYTARIVSASGKRDGLYWETPAGQPSSPLGKVGDFARSDIASASPDKPLTIDGYVFRVLSAQGGKAGTGAKSYVVDGKMTGGFAIVASPASYRESGIMSFIMNREGVVYEKDLGEKTAEVAAAIDTYNPDEGWTPIE